MARPSPVSRSRALLGFAFSLLLLCPPAGARSQALEGREAAGFRPADPASISQRSLGRILDRHGKPTAEGAFDFRIDKVHAPLPLVYLNVLADLNRNETLEQYPVSADEVQSEWIVRDVPLVLDANSLSDPRIRIWFDLPDRALSLGTAVKTHLRLSREPLGQTALPLRARSLGREWRTSSDPTVRVQWGAKDLSGRLKSRRALSAAGHPALGNDIALVLPGPLAAGGLPDLDQRSNECAPTSSLNSLLYQAQRLHVTDRLPRDGAGRIDTAAMLRGLKRSMKEDEGYWKVGVSDGRMLKGLSRYLRETELPLKTKGGPRDPSSQGVRVFSFVAEELRQGRPSQLAISWPDSGGHWVTVAGYAVAGGRAFLYVHDPDDDLVGKAVWELQMNADGSVPGELVHPLNCTADLALSSAEPASLAASAGPSGPAAPAPSVLIRTAAAASPINAQVLPGAP